MIFAARKPVIDGYQQRYISRHAAIQGHQEAVKYALLQLRKHPISSKRARIVKKEGRQNAVIGKIIQHLLDKGFYVSYVHAADNIHRFTIWKLYEDKECEASWIVHENALNHSMSHDILMMYAEPRMKYIDDAITQRRLIEEALQP